MTATPALTTDLQRQVGLLRDDLLKRLDEDKALRDDWERKYREAKEKDRTARSWTEWREDRIDQTAVAWVLTSVFVRFCEDNHLVKPVWITGPGGRHQEALDAHLAFFRQPEHAEDTDREWLLDAFEYLGNLPATKPLVDTHSALKYASPSGKSIENLLKFWRERSDDGDGALTHDLHDETLSTRFLGDLYQDLSAYAKETYALLQTPVFVEEHILDRTLEPALKERQLEGFRMIDPTCGSGHFLLGAFARLLDRWQKHAPAMETQAQVQTALDAIHGVDLNPFAVAIARFRLMVAALQACELSSLEEAPAFNFHLAVGDSLIHGPDKDVLPGMESRGAYMPHHYATEDAALLLEILQEGRYDAVVGNPPYIQPPDKAQNKNYRSKFGKVCKGAYQLTVPFMIQFFVLAKRGGQPGWVGQITGNGFMDREFGTPLIEEFLPTLDLRLIEDTSDAYIPGHGTPTVIIVGRNQPPTDDAIRAVLGIRGEPSKPDDPAKGLVWRSIVDHVDQAGWDDEWISVVDLARKHLTTHPWTLRGGGAGDLKEAIENSSSRTIESSSSDIGFGAVTREDDAYMLGRATLTRLGVPDRNRRPLIEGKSIREWDIDNRNEALWPYNPETLEPECDPAALKFLWNYRSILAERVAYGESQIERGLEWFEYSMFFRHRYRGNFTIAIPTVATHVHASLDRSHLVFKDASVLIKIRQGSDEDAHINLLGVLNSSTACFWLKQVCHNKSGSGIGRGIQPEHWMDRYQFNGANIQEYPLPNSFPLERSRLLDSLAQELSAQELSVGHVSTVPSQESLVSAQKTCESIRARMIAVQEELDWQVYQLYGLIEEDLTCALGDLPELALGERAFEIALTRSNEQTAWFERHGSERISDLPGHWPIAYRELVQRRMQLIEEHPYIRLLEKPEYKRRWSQKPWEEGQEEALREWLLDRLEDKRFWFDSSGNALPRSVGQLADEVSHDEDMVSVLALWEGRPDVSVTDSLVRLLSDEGVPFLAAHLYKESGIRKRRAWEETWDLQRREDRGDEVGGIAVPPKYTSADFWRASYWRARGKLDVPKERFILYPDASRDGDPTQLLGWAGWDHAQQALALAQIIGEREQEGWDDERLVPLVAGLAELQPWVEQWHSDVDPKYRVSLAAFCREELDGRAQQVGKTIEELAAWRPAPTGRGRKKTGTD
jgi:hypothetical protein